jgi:DNA polymerase-3 subunit delta'
MHLAIHPETKKAIDNMIESTPQVVILTGPAGIGKKALARYTAEKLLKIDSLDNYAHVLKIFPENKSIGIESIRQLINFLSLKVPIKASPNQVVIIEEAHAMTQESQNALLKTLEEPPLDTVIIMTLTYSNLLLPTVISRARVIPIIRPSRTSLRQNFKNVSEESFNNAYNLSSGLPGLLSAILNQTDHPLAIANKEARVILTSSLYDRLLMVNSLSKEMLKFLSTVDIIERMANTALLKNSDTIKWQKVLKACYETKQACLTNAQAKLIVLKFMLSI